MEQKCDRPSLIPDAAITEAFTRAHTVKFSARRHNTVAYRSIAFGDFHWWLPLARVFPLIGVTPQMLRPVFNPQHHVLGAKTRVPVKRSFPMNIFEALGWPKTYKEEVEYEIATYELPEKIETYDQLGAFPLDEKPFQELARILGKSVEVWREDGTSGYHRHLFTALPSGEIIEAVEA